MVLIFHEARCNTPWRLSKYHNHYHWSECQSYHVILLPTYIIYCLLTGTLVCLNFFMVRGYLSLWEVHREGFVQQCVIWGFPLLNPPRLRSLKGIQLVVVVLLLLSHFSNVSSAETRMDRWGYPVVENREEIIGFVGNDYRSFHLWRDSEDLFVWSSRWSVEEAPTIVLSPNFDVLFIRDALA